MTANIRYQRRNWSKHGLQHGCCCLMEKTDRRDLGSEPDAAAVLCNTHQSLDLAPDCSICSNHKSHLPTSTCYVWYSPIRI